MAPRVKTKSQPADTRDLGRKYRKVFKSVIDVYTEVKASIGQPGAIDYQRSEAGKKPYSTTFDNAVMTRLMDFVADVELCTNALDDTGHKFIWNNCLDKEPSWDVQSEEFLYWQEKMGRVFLSRGLYPTKEYFVMVRK